jgi:hypothetical protein
MGLMQAVGTVEVVDQYLDDPWQLALAQDSMTEARVMPWYRYTAQRDLQRAAQINAAIQGQRAPVQTDHESALARAMIYDADLFRAYEEIASLLSLPQEVIARPAMIERITEVVRAHEPLSPPDLLATSL